MCIALAFPVAKWTSGEQLRNRTGLYNSLVYMRPMYFMFLVLMNAKIYAEIKYTVKIN